ncbi:MAG: ABC-F family ATP-binding cassette domain-containing protein [Planctomycetes bacterium]|jgi:ATP-binding cassette subfamily F protein uup|nr:ABC-F family ATP-binding cassette domain-containing protein [Planctomycetota bacterium]MBT4028471.1 ABC-F family ATP-binding cassette domain-containing protein [Planctomycetota bacterium]MBT5101829.1 ABC-F family ATP-binding cassette domain-containing protein [Planctomycetota bacterium]MBT7317613.1 ABC-F family ATP-binding cassette domain-containing protein [Planctomycetota bacterium]
MPLLTLSGVAKTYDEQRPLFAGVDLTVTSTDRIGLIGPNGAGKSTLLKIMAGIEIADAGERVMRRGVRVGYLEQEPHFPSEMTIEEAVRAGLEGREALLADLEALYTELADPDLSEKRLGTLSRRQEEMEHRLEEMGGHDVEHRISAAITGVGLADASAKCGTLSGGEARRVALARLLVDGPDIMLLDEPTNHLDAFVIAWLEKQLAALKVPLILVTHDRFLLDRVVNRIVEVDRGSIYSYPGSYHTYVERRAERLASEQKSESSRLALLKRETAWMRAGVLGRGTKAKARQDRFHALASVDKLTDDAHLEMAIPRGPRLGNKVVEVEGLSFAYGDQPILRNLDLKIERNMRLGIVGPNGVGKTTLIRLLLGQLAADAGTVTVGETVAFGTLDQKREDLDPEATVAEEVAGKSSHVRVGDRDIHVVSFLDQFLFPGNLKFVKVGSLSGGERGRVLLAKLLLQDCNLLVLDEPTNDLDLNTLRALEEALCAFHGSVLLVSHDRWFLDRVATHVLYLDGLGGAFLHTGDVSSLMERWSPPSASDKPSRVGASARKTSDAKPAQVEASGPLSQSSEKVVKLSFKEKEELKQLWAQIEIHEAQLSEVDAKLADPSIYQDAGETVPSLQKERAVLDDQLVTKMSRWEELAARE